MSDKIAVGLSGGVDSAVSAALLKQQGYDVTAVYIECYASDADYCTAEADRAEAAKVAAYLDIPFIHLDFKNEYKSKVLDNFYYEYAHGRVPNPDILCNSEIKFGMFLDWALSHNYDKVATGHYARNIDDMLHVGVDEKKDQSYFLYKLTFDKLHNITFPIGTYKKTEVRKMASTFNLPNKDRPESMGICFVGDVDIREFLSLHLKTKKGDVINQLGEVIGDHDGVHLYTVGQRHGFNITKYQGIPLYVIDKDINKNIIVVGPKEMAFSKEFSVGEINMLLHEVPSTFECNIRIRHLGKLYPASVTMLPGNLAKVVLSDPIFAVSPGQSAVFYSDTLVLGGGIIVGSTN